MLSFTVTSATQVINLNKRIPSQILKLKSYRLEMDSQLAAVNRKIVYVSLPFLSDAYVLDENPQATTLQLFTADKVWLRETDIEIPMSNDINYNFEARIYDGPIYAGSFTPVTNFVSLTLVFELTDKLIKDEEKQLPGILTLRQITNTDTHYIANKIERQILTLTGYRVEMTSAGLAISKKLVYLELPFCNNQEHLIGNTTRFMIPLLLGDQAVTDVQGINIPIYCDDISDNFTMNVYDNNFALSSMEDIAVQFKFSRDIT